MAGLCFLIDDQVVVVWHTTLDDNTLDTFTNVVVLLWLCVMVVQRTSTQSIPSPSSTVKATDRSFSTTLVTRESHPSTVVQLLWASMA